MALPPEKQDIDIYKYLRDWPNSSGANARAALIDMLKPVPNTPNIGLDARQMEGSASAGKALGESLTTKTPQPLPTNASMPKAAFSPPSMENSRPEENFSAPEPRLGDNYPGKNLNDFLRSRESGGKIDALNPQGYAGVYQIGAPLAYEAGFYKPGPEENISSGWSGAKWSGTFQIPGYPQVKTLKDFLNNPAAQDVAYRLSMAVKDRQLSSKGLYDYVGKVIGGVPVTRDGILAGAWLGGANGVEAYLKSNGVINRRDANGTSIQDYMRLGASPRPTPELNAYVSTLGGYL
jgi:hypothetical protein